jgi:hypothetical protein
LYVLETKKSCPHVPLVHGTEKHWKGQEKKESALCYQKWPELKKKKHALSREG